MDDKVKVFGEDLSKFCKNKSFKLSENWERVAEAILRKNKNCPCRFEQTPCPCEYCEREVKEDGHCHCGLFISKGEKSE